MKPKTKIQREVWDLHKKLSMPREHEPFIISNHKFYYTTHYKNLVCMECNHKWKPDQVWHEQVVGVVCPECNKKLKKIATENGGMALRRFVYSDAKVVDRFQVVRYFSCSKHMSKNKKPRYSFHSLFEEWKDWDKNKQVIVGRIQTNYGDGFTNSDYEIRGYGLPRWESNPYDSFQTDINCPGAELLPRFSKFRLTSFRHDMDYRFLINVMENSSQAETLFKAKQYSLLGKFGNHHGHRINQHWPSIKIALRNKYKIKDAGIWLDYLDNLRHFGKDLRSPKFVCPKNLKAAHDNYMKKKRREDIIRQMQRDEQAKIARQKKLEIAVQEYIDRNQKFFDIEMAKGSISIQPIKSIDEMREEGDELRHCVFTNEYYLKTDTLCFSAKVDGRRMETVEISLKNFKVIQARGVGNRSTEYHDKIVALVKKNMYLLQQRLQKPKTTKQSNSLKKAA